MTSSDTAPPRHILVATDLSAQSGPAVARAARLAARHGARLTAVFVAERGTDPELTAYAARRLREHAEEHATGLGAAPAETVVTEGRTAARILAEAEERGAGLLVVGAHGAHRLPEALVGSTAQNLVRASHCPVLVVRGPATGEYRTVLLAVDTSRISLDAARTGSALTPGARHVLAHADIVPGEHLMVMRGAGEEALTELRRVSTRRARAAIGELAAALDPAPAEIVVESGRPESALPALSAGHGADLVVVGTGTHSKLGYVLLGSVAEHVIREAPADVLVVRGTRA
ncbi:universal stress protein [Streptomyces sodiiphilus]|uniref:Universal stress protein n=1 Tax=Streptomyces sodiiphilus TaxID=226217 RepID=A0ABN2PMY9_9ACTN